MSEPAKKIEDELFVSMALEFKQLKEDDEYFRFEGYLATYGNVDRVDDVFVKGCFDKSLESHTPRIRWVHEKSEIVGIFEEIKSDDYGLFVRGKMPKSDTMVTGRVIPQMKCGSIRDLSVGFKTLNYEYSEEGKRLIYEAFLGEGSLVDLPANDRAKIMDFKKFEIDSIKTIETKRDLEKILRELGLSQKAAVYLASRTDFDSSDSDVVKANGELAKELKRLTETINKL